MALCPGLPGWAGTRRNIHPLTPLLLINHPYHLPPSTTNHSIIIPGAQIQQIMAVKKRATKVDDKQHAMKHNVCIFSDVHLTGFTNCAIKVPKPKHLKAFFVRTWWQNLKLDIFLHYTFHPAHHTLTLHIFTPHFAFLHVKKFHILQTADNAHDCLWSLLP